MFIGFLEKQQEQLAKFDANNDEEFVMAVKILLRTGTSQRLIAARIGVNPATISRWAQGQKLPTRPLLRKAYLSEMQVAMGSLIP